MSLVDSSNTNFQLAAGFIKNTNRSVFLTGKAGTGKTTFLKYIKEHANKQTVVLAPTGVAAINAGGATMHSFFNLPFGPFLPGTKKGFASSNESVNDNHSLIARLRYNKEKKELIQSLELLIIDEVSMVRADILDAVDLILKTFRHQYAQPFGGVQVLLIGDMYQLPPVVKDDEWQLIKEYYNSPYFFDSIALQQSFPLYIELEKIYRQSDQIFIDLLNQVRNNNLDNDGFELLHSRYQQGFNPSKEEGYITLSTHNYKADAINENQLNKIPASPFVCKAIIAGEFTEKQFPAEENLVLKVGAQVMFIKNDTEKIRRYFNGKIGTLSRYDADNKKIFVQCLGEENEIEVKQDTWKNIRYTLSKQHQQVEEDEIGTFTQYPLRLAWAITIHKSQGLTFQKAIIDAGAAFAPGQVYVALSRCTSLQGLVLHSRINSHSILTDERIHQFAKQKHHASQLTSQLANDKFNYQCSTLLALFLFEDCTKAAGAIEKLIATNTSSFGEQALVFVKSIAQNTNKLKEVGVKFQQKLTQFFEDKTLPEQNTAMQARLKDAANWFSIFLQNELIAPIKQSPVITDSKTNAELYNQALAALYQLLWPKYQLMNLCKNGFVLDDFLSTKSKAGIAMLLQNAYAGAATNKPKTDSPHPMLHKQLKALRDELCQPKNTPIYLVANSTTLDEMARYLPQTKEELAKISGFGPVKIEQYGSPFLAIIQQYCTDNNVTTLIHQKDPKPQRKEKAAGSKPDTKLETYKLFITGKTIADIATQRNLTTGTIEGHLGHYVLLEELQLEQVISKEKIDLIVAAAKEIGSTATAPIKDKIGNAVSYAQVKLVMQCMQQKEG